jgi:hypothetical protein
MWPLGVALGLLCRFDRQAFDVGVGVARPENAFLVLRMRASALPAALRIWTRATSCL